MGDFEREIVHYVNRFFRSRHVQGFAYRLKQHKFSSQYVDVLINSLNPSYYLAIECKSILDKKIYFSQHFHSDKNGTHQIDAIDGFLKRPGAAVSSRSNSGSGRGRQTRHILSRERPF